MNHTPPLHSPPQLCTGTGLSVKRLTKRDNVIEATILNGKFKEDDILLPRIPTIPTDMPFQLERLQFPMRIAFVMTISKAPGQSLQVRGLDLETSRFSHGQLYVACSRVGKPSNLRVYAPGGSTIYSNVLACVNIIPILKFLAIYSFSE